jgi:hypothetical protein
MRQRGIDTGAVSSTSRLCQIYVLANLSFPPPTYGHNSLQARSASTPVCLAVASQAGVLST